MITSKNTSTHQLPAIAKKVEKLYGWVSGTRNLDIGAGKYDELTEYLRRKKVENFPYDPYNRTALENFLALSCGPYDTVTLANVLNVIQDKDERGRVIELASKLVRSDRENRGRVYFTVYEGDRGGVGRVSKRDCWQENRRTETYIEEIRQFFSVIRVCGKVIVCLR